MGRVADADKSHHQKEKTGPAPARDAGSWTDSRWSGDWRLATLESVWGRRGAVGKASLLGELSSGRGGTL